MGGIDEYEAYTEQYKGEHGKYNLTILTSVLDEIKRIIDTPEYRDMLRALS